MLSISNEKSDNGGQSLQMKFLTEEEANAADAMEWNSKTAYGASEEDLVTFLEVRLLQGPVHSLNRRLACSELEASKGTEVRLLRNSFKHTSQRVVSSQ